MNQSMGRYLHAAALLILVLVPLVFFWDMVVYGQEPLAADTQAVKPLGVWAGQAQEELGGVPLWCPGIFAGMPSYGSFIYTPSSPLNLLRNLRLPFDQNRGARYFLSLLAGAVALYAWLIWRGGHPLAALGGTLIYVMTPYFLGLVAAGHSTKLHALYLVPAVFFALDGFLAKRSAVTAILLAVAIAFQLWCHHPQISYYTLFLGALYAAGVLAFDRPRAWRDRRLYAGLGGGLVALALVAALMLEPYGAVLEYAPHSIRGGGGALQAAGAAGGGVGWDYATAWSYPPEELICFFFPAWFGLAGQSYWGSLHFTQSTHYFGLTALVLALLGLVLTRGRRRWLWMMLGVITLLIGFGRHLPVLFGPMYHLMPMFNRFRVPSMIYALLPLFIGILAADGLTALIRPGPGRRKGAPAGGALGWGSAVLRRWMPVTVVLGALLVLWMLFGGLLADGLRSSGAFVHAGEAARLGPHGESMLEALRTQPMERLMASSSLPAGFAEMVAQRMGTLRATVFSGLLLLFLTAGVIEMRRRGRIGGTLAVAALVGLVAVDLWTVDRKFYHPVPRSVSEAVLSPDGVTGFLQSQPGPFRIAPLVQTPGSAHGFGSNRYAAFGLESVGGYQPAKLRIYDDLIRSGAAYSPPVLSMLGVGYIISEMNLEPAGLPRLYEESTTAGGSVYVYGNPDVLPRAWFVSRVRRLPDARALIEALQSEAFDPLAIAYLTREVYPELPERFAAGVVERATYGLHEIRLAVEVAGEPGGLLVLGEIYYEPGWRATIDGVAAPILRVNHVLRAVEVPPGAHEVRLQAVSPAYRAGLWVSRGTGVLCLLVLVGAWVRARRSARQGVVEGD